MTLKVMTIVGTRPEIIKLSRVINELESHTNHILVHTGQNYDYELNQVFFNDLGVSKPNYFLEAAGETPALTIAKVISSVDEVLEKESPDAILLYGDTNSCISVISAKRRKIPIFHMEAGNRCFDQRVPEELNRKIVDHLSDINMVHSEHSRKYLEKEGINPETIIKTGSPMREIFDYYKEKIDSSNVLKDLDVTKGEFFIVSAHREENVDSEINFENFLDTLNFIAKEYDKKVIVSTHPRTRKKLEALGEREFDKRIQFLKPLGFFDYNKMQKEAFCVVSDSGTLTEESNILGFPGIMIRQAHERPEGMDVGAVIMSGLTSSRVKESIDLITSHYNELPPESIEDYAPKMVSKHVVRIIQSYTDYINRVVWKKFL
ncbi:non-hydrolyzing UDP-N-acetylglucosamine 2-epimerase [Halobacteriovorax sp. HLS]|uniref:non-hydrolyzing UDP-N-acetylglucosamine 2-epimerase n=1 Tax=Halobacteriovorax sp. HLS TaxID=2234000 RepID=UPI0013E404FF|nr:UDP-N-acetylglucosamine 2-epimerase (non-hydrolyzing) [Halobacteriovorax sp. HLS]